MNVLRLLKTRHYKVKKGNQISLQKQFLSIVVSSSHERKTLNLDLLTLDETIKVRRNELVTVYRCDTNHINLKISGTCFNRKNPICTANDKPLVFPHLGGLSIDGL